MLHLILYFISAVIMSYYCYYLERRHLECLSGNYLRGLKIFGLFSSGLNLFVSCFNLLLYCYNLWIGFGAGCYLLGYLLIFNPIQRN